MVKKAKHYAKQPINTDEITSEMVKNGDLLLEDLDLTKPFNFPFLSVGVDSGAGILIADLTSAFGNPATIADGTVFVYKDTGTSKIYLVIVIDDAFYLEELSAAAAE